MAKPRRSEIKDTLEFAGPEVVVDMVLELEKDNAYLKRALARADARRTEIARERDDAIGRAAAAEVRCRQIPVWTRLAEDLAAATTEAECWALQARARSILAGGRG